MRKAVLQISALAGCLLAPAYASAQGAAEPQPVYEKRSYISGLELLGHSFPGQERGGKMQMMIKGDKRYMVQTSFGHPGGWIIDVTDPLKPVIVNAHAFPEGDNVQVAWRGDLQKWIAMVSVGQTEPGAPGFRGVQFWDITNPEHTLLLSSWSQDGGDPARKVQEGGRPHRNYYDGGRYAYISTSPNDEYYLTEGDRRGYQGALQIIDVSDIEKPKLVSNVHMPGQLASEVQERAASETYAHPFSGTSMHGPAYVPTRLEDGGKYAYGSWNGFGMAIHDVSDPTAVSLVSTWVPKRIEGRGFLVHTVDPTHVGRGFVIVTPEEVAPGCSSPRFENSIVDVSDPAHPFKIADLPTPTAPADAPYTSFCDRYGRFGTHNAPHLKAPGKAAANFTCYTWFAAGLQCYDITDPKSPRIVSYFVPEQGADDGIRARGARTADDVFIEWDRKLIWVSTDTGNYVLSSPELGEPVLGPAPAAEWTLPGLNVGHP